MGQRAVFFQALQDRKGHSIAVTRPERIEQSSSLLVTGHRLNAKHSTGIILSLGLWQRALGLQKRRRWRAKDATGTPGGILDAVTGGGPWFTMVRQESDPSVQQTLESIEASGGSHGYLLCSQGITTFTLSVSLGNRHPFISQIYNCWRIPWFIRRGRYNAAVAEPVSVRRPGPDRSDLSIPG